MSAGGDLTTLLSDLWVAARVGTPKECEDARASIVRHVVALERAAFFNGAMYGEIECAYVDPPPDDFPAKARREAAVRYNTMPREVPA